jgi:competence ComEA-like helix-hairpin-helix protein
MAVMVFSIGVLLFETRLPDTYIEVAPFRVHLQTASATELELMPGIGPKMAQRIIEYRETHSLKTADDLDGVFGIGTRKIEHLRWLVYKDEEQQ